MSRKRNPKNKTAARRPLIWALYRIRKDSRKFIIPVFCKFLDLVAIIAQYYRNVNNKIQETEIVMKHRY